jgi:hypothetical protein
MSIPCNDDSVTNDQIITYCNKVSQVSGLQNYVYLNIHVRDYLLSERCHELNELYYPNYLLSDETCHNLFSKYTSFEKLYPNMYRGQPTDVQKNALDIKLEELFEQRSHDDKLIIVTNYKNVPDDMYRINAAFDTFKRQHNAVDLR